MNFALGLPTAIHMNNNNLSNRSIGDSRNNVAIRPQQNPLTKAIPLEKGTLYIYKYI